MPCPCRLPVEKYPETTEWGPLFWKLLHGLAHRAGYIKDFVSRTDERKSWIQVLNKLALVIPCEICRSHYTLWLNEHSPDTLLTIDYNLLGNWLRTYFFQLHNRVNEGNDKPLMEESELGALYNNINIKQCWKQLDQIILRAINLNGVTLLPWKQFIGNVRILQGLYGI